MNQVLLVLRNGPLRIDAVVPSLVSISLLAVAIVFSVCCAFCDISSENWDLATFGSEDGHLNHYFSWWWCSQRPK